MSKPVFIVGAGFSGAVIARELADCGIPSAVFDQGSHEGGHAERCKETGVNVHKMAPISFQEDFKFNTPDRRMIRLKDSEIPIIAG